MSSTSSNNEKIEVITSIHRRRKWSQIEKKSYSSADIRAWTVRVLSRPPIWYTTQLIILLEKANDRWSFDWSWI